MLFLRFALLFIFFIQSFLLNAPVAFAGDPLYLPVAGQMIHVSASFDPVMIQGLQYDPQKPFRLGFMVAPGDKNVPDSQLQEQAMGLVRYFLAVLTIPQDDVWVNLSPYEKDRVIPQDLALTRLGSELLAQDYVLKQLAASLIYPKGEVGKVFWQKVYAASMQRYGRTDLPINTFSKVWIVPGDAEVFVHGYNVVVTKSHLKVMMQEDYLASRKFSNPGIDLHQDKFMTQDLSGRVMREVVLPVLEHEVNQGAYFAPLRQILNVAILAEWYKRHLKDSLVSRAYADLHKIAGINEPSMRDQIYTAYVKAYQKGVFNYIQDGAGQEAHSRKYFSGGLNMKIANIVSLTDSAQLGSDALMILGEPNYRMINIGLLPADTDLAMTAGVEAFMANPDNQNPSWRFGQIRLRNQAGFMNDKDPRLIEDLLNEKVRITKGWFDIDLGPKLGKKWVWEGRLAKNDILGTPKGGIRYITARDLMRTSFSEVWGRFLKLKPTVEEAQAFVAQWLEEELEFLATWGMTGKAAGLNLELGGAKGLVLKGGIIKGADGLPWFEPWDVDQFSARERLELDLRIAQHHARELTNADAVGMGVDSPAPDMNTGPEILEKYNEEYLRVLTERGSQAFAWDGQTYSDLYTRLKAILDHINDYTIFENPLLEEAVRFSQEHPGLPMPWIGVFTGKRYERPVDPDDPSKGTVKMGGVTGRNEATGEGIVMVMERFLEHTVGGYKGKTVAVQGFGNVGRYTALAAAREGFIVKVINDFGITLYSDNPGGWSLPQLQRIIQAMKDYHLSLRDLWIKNPIPGLFEVFDRQESFIPFDTEKTDQMATAFSKVIGAQVDILVPAFREEQITKENADSIKALWIFEGANGPVTSDADYMLMRKGKIVVPDTLVNAGGVLCSGLEMQQAMRGREFSLDEVLGQMKAILGKAVENTLAQGNDINIRQYYDMVGLDNLALSPARTKRVKDRLDLDAAMATRGGIDLNTGNMRIDEEGDMDTRWVLPSVALGQEGQIKGFEPVFINMRSVNIRSLLGW